MIWMIVGGLCLAYFVALVSVGMDFSLIWLLGGAVLFGWGAFRRFGKWSLPSGLRISLEVFVGVCLVIFLLVEGLIFSGMFSKGKDNLDYLIVLGAQVRKQEPSPALKKRLHTAYAYLEKNPDTKVVVSGGKGSGEEISEAEAMCKYLLELGIEKERILMEDASTNTVENLKFSAELIDKEAQVGIVTNNFHVYRSVRLARKQGYTSDRKSVV